MKKQRFYKCFLLNIYPFLVAFVVILLWGFVVFLILSQRLFRYAVNTKRLD